MGNLVGTGRKGRSLVRRESPIGLLLDSLSERPSEATMRIIYGPIEMLQAQLAINARIPPTLPSDLVELRGIFQLTHQSNSIEELKDETCDLIATCVARMNKPDKLISIISLVIAGQLQGTIELLNIKSCLELLKILLESLGGIVHACGGDPVHFSSATGWLRRIHLVHSIITEVYHEVTMIKEKHTLLNYTDIGDGNGWEAVTSEDSIECTVAILATQLTLRLTNEKLYTEAINVGVMMIAALENFLLAPPPKSFPLLSLAIGRSLIGIGEFEQAPFHLVNFVATSNEAVLEAIGLKEDTTFRGKELAAMYCLSLKELVDLPKVIISIGQAMLPLVSNKKATSDSDYSARDIIYERMIMAFMDEEAFANAHECVIAIFDDSLSKKLTSELVKRMIRSKATEELCSLRWGLDGESIVESLLSSFVDDAEYPVLADYEGLPYKWYLSRGNLQSAASVMYKFALRSFEHPRGNLSERYYALGLAINCLELSSEQCRWLTVLRGKIPEPLTEEALNIEKMDTANDEIVVNSAQPSQIFKKGIMTESLDVIMVDEDMVKSNDRRREVVYSSNTTGDGDDGQGCLKIVDLKQLKSEIVLARAQLYVGRNLSHRELLFQLLAQTRVSQAIKVILEFPPDGWDLVASFLIDSFLDSQKVPDMEQSWLVELIACQSTIINTYNEEEQAQDESAEMVVLTDFLQKLNCNDAYLGVVEMLLECKVPPTPRLIAACCKRNANQLLKLLGKHQQLYMILKLLADEQLRSTLTAGTLAYLEIITRI